MSTIFMVSTDIEYKMAKHKKINKTRNNIILTSKISIGFITSIIAMSTTATVIMPAANAEVLASDVNNNGNSEAVTAARSFPAQKKITAADKETLLKESVSVDNVDGKWEGLGEEENIGENIKKDADRQTAEINARKAAEEAKKKAEEEEEEEEQARKKKEAEETAKKEAEEARNNANASINVSRSQLRTPVIDDNASSSKYGAAIARAAVNHVGDAMWCTDLATAALNDAGIGFPVMWPEQYVNVPGSVNIGNDLSKAEPGDLIIYNRTGRNGSHNDHIAVYIGGGMAVHGGWNYTANVQIATANVGDVWAIIRVN